MQKSYVKYTLPIGDHQWELHIPPNKPKKIQIAKSKKKKMSKKQKKNEQ